MRITTWNVNGLRAAIRKGFADQIAEIQPDLLLLQEIRVTPDQLDEEWRSPDGWHVHWHPAQRKGYSGTAVWSRLPFEIVGTGTSEADPDDEGRLISVLCEGLNVSSVYLPSGSSKPERQIVKEAWMNRFRSWVTGLPTTGPAILGGDLNIAHTEKDIFYAKANEKSSGFLPHEREWFGDLLKAGWHDTARHHFGDVQGPYSWWSNRGRARELDRGWRIDYLLANAAAHSRFRSATIHREAGITVSDHAPVSIDLD
ncbi:exodeoxyribonuclease III [Fuerstiella marisgermanici]|uniref:Exodeoxyribonuclease n=1 Tax=Fuerstiella marisgermanici TaxID=1891926 RepID=A0A1P8WQ72_9PLAN|nr:exodeoxyribonuclease III [Fuerstiella marisgermanici]APZ96199.1 Exodeoxyribonuclease [Fuerstiella marisgermanici]